MSWTLPSEKMISTVSCQSVDHFNGFYIFLFVPVFIVVLFIWEDFFLRFMTFDFEWVCLRKSENIMSDACCLVLFFFPSFSSIWIVLVCLVLASILLLCKFSICWDDLSLNFFRCLSWQLFTFPLLFALASITTLQTLNALLIRWRRCCSLLCVFITFKLCLMLFFTFVKRSNQFVSTENFIKTRDAVVQYY